MKCTTYFLKHTTGNPLRFVLGEPCPCSDLSLATFFPDLPTATAARDAHCTRSTQVWVCYIKAEKARFRKEPEPMDKAVAQ